MLNIFEYFKSKKQPQTAEEAEKQVRAMDEMRFPAKSETQREYREEFGGIVDQFIISYYSERDAKNPNGYHHIVYIGADDNLYWSAGGGQEEEEVKDSTANNANQGNKHAISILNNPKYLESTSRLRNLLYSPMPNLPRSELITFRKMIGMGCKAALNGSWSEVENAINTARKYRDERNREYSRFIFLSAATVYLVILAIIYIVYIYLYPYLCCVSPVASIKDIPHIDLLTGMIMGAVGVYVSICTRYGKIDMSGLGLKRLHYFEAFTRILVGIIFAMIIIFGVRGNLFLGDMPTETVKLYVYSILGFCAGFSEKWVPSVLEKFIGREEKTPIQQEEANDQTQGNSEKSVN